LTAVTGTNSLLRRSKITQRDPMSEHSGRVSELLHQWVQGDRDALDVVTPEFFQMIGISPATVERDWATARIWLRREMQRVAAP
jgi:ABC-type molybdenum transport system ATPase subunit/photorepair protein PhrA